MRNYLTNYINYLIYLWIKNKKICIKLTSSLMNYLIAFKNKIRKKNLNNVGFSDFSYYLSIKKLFIILK